MKALFANADAGMIGLLFFFIVFVFIILWALSPKNKKAIEAHKYIPLKEDENHDLKR